MNLSNKNKSLEDAAKVILEGKLIKEEAKVLLEKTELAGWEDGGTHANSKFKILEFIGPDELEAKLGSRKCLEIEKVSESRTSGATRRTFMSLNANDINELREFLQEYSTEEDEPNIK